MYSMMENGFKEKLAECYFSVSVENLQNEPFRLQEVMRLFGLAALN